MTNMKPILDPIIRKIGIVLFLFAISATLFDTLDIEIVNLLYLLLVLIGIMLFFFFLIKYVLNKNLYIEMNVNGTIHPKVILIIGASIILCWNLIFKVSVVSDGMSYYAHARNLAESGVYGFNPSEPEVHWPPGYALLLASFFRLLGSNYWVVSLINILLYLASVSLLYLFGKEIYSRENGIIAAIMLCFWPNYLFLSNTATKELLLLFLIIASLFFLYRYLYKKMRMINLLLSGLMMGLLALTQPAIVVLFPCMIIPFWFFGIKMCKLIPVTTVLIVVVFLTILPWSIRNYITFDEVIPITNSGGGVFYRANNENAKPGYNAPSNGYALEKFTGKEKSDLGYKLGKEWIINNPIDFLSLGLRKAVMFAGNDNTALWQTKSITDRKIVYTLLSLITKVWWFLIVSILTYRYMDSKRKIEFIDYVNVLSFAIMVLVDMIFESGSRHHIPLYPLFCVVLSRYLLKMGHNNIVINEGKLKEST